MASAKPTTVGAAGAQLKTNHFGSDDKAHPAGCRCDKCTYVQVTPVVDPVQDGKANGEVKAGAAVGVKAMLHRITKGGGMRTGMKPIKFRMPYSFSISCAAGGVIASAQVIAADSNSTEWAAIATVYDEYRVLGGVIDWAPSYQTPAGVQTVDSAFCCIAYDPVDGTIPTSVRNLCEATQHDLRAAQPTSIVANSSNVSLSFGKAAGRPYRFRFRTTPVSAAALTNTGTFQVDAGMWKRMNTATNNINDGFLKFYGTSDFAAASACITGIIFLDVEFRSRT